MTVHLQIATSSLALLFQAVSIILGKMLFGDCALESVVIPDSITAIGDYAFVVNTHLKSVTLPKHLKTIGQGAFQVCKALTSISIPESVETVGRAAFKYTGLPIPLLSNDNSILYYVPSSFTSYAIPDSVRTINAGALEGCSKLTSVTLPAYMVSIGEYAFYECSSLKDISIPESVVSVGTCTFSATSITKPVYISSQTVLCHVPASIESFIIPETVVAINGGAFFRCVKLNSISIPNSVTAIGDDAFFGCTNLSSINIPDSVNSLGSERFIFCTKMTSVNLSNNLTNLKSDVFAECYALSQVEIPHQVNTIGPGAFRWCYALTSITIPVNVTSIGYGVFDSCKSLMIYGLVNSCVQNYAELNNIPFYGVTITDTAIWNNITVIINGSLVTFEAYTINGSNYIKLRDLALALTGTSKQFDVGWDGEINSINLLAGNAYTPVGGELTSAGCTGILMVEMTGSKLILNGKQIFLAAYQINGNYFFKLRDIGQSLNFGVTWDGRSKTIKIDTSTGYTA